MSSFRSKPLKYWEWMASMFTTYSPNRVRLKIEEKVLCSFFQFFCKKKFKHSFKVTLSDSLLLTLLAVSTRREYYLLFDLCLFQTNVYQWKAMLPLTVLLPMQIPWMESLVSAAQSIELWELDCKLIIHCFSFIGKNGNHSRVLFLENHRDSGALGYASVNLHRISGQTETT